MSESTCSALVAILKFTTIPDELLGVKAIINIHMELLKSKLLGKSVFNIGYEFGKCFHTLRQ